MDQVIQEGVVPIFANPQGTDADARQPCTASAGDTLIFVAVGAPVGQQNQVADDLIAVEAVQLLQPSFQALEELRPPAGPRR